MEKLKKVVNIVDAPCGCGKTTSAINMINNSTDEERYMYITPYLTEVQRIKDSCASKKFKEPKIVNSSGSKIDGLVRLISNGENIVTTHALFKHFDEIIIELLRINNYTLIMDEVADVVEILEITKKDLDIILKNCAGTGEDGVLEWKDKEYTGEYDKYKKLCELGCLTIYGENSNKIVLFWLFPISVFRAFSEIYILTYFFDAQIQKYYFDYYGVEYNYLYTRSYNFTKEKQKYDTKIYKNLINICSNKRLNKIGEEYYSISHNWFSRLKKDDVEEVIAKTLKKNIHNFFQNICRTNSKDNMWTTFKSEKSVLSGTGYTKGFVSLNARATNDYKEKKSVAYLANRFFNPLIKKFFYQREIKVNEDKFALSELLQFIFRSQLREKRPINLYLPSKRMRDILQNWLDTCE